MLKSSLLHEKIGKLERSQKKKKYLAQAKYLLLGIKYVYLLFLVSATSEADDPENENENKHDNLFYCRLQLFMMVLRYFHHDVFFLDAKCILLSVDR